MDQRRTALETRELVFEACSRILRRHGLSELTLENVAEEADLSKGGLLYHFPSKESLIEALFEYHNEKFEARLSALAEEEGDDTGAWLRAYAKACIEQIMEPGNASLYASLFAAEERYEGAHRLMRQRYIVWQQQIENSGLDPARATLVRLAVEGLWFLEMHHYAPPDPQQREQIVDLIMQLTYDSVQISG